MRDRDEFKDTRREFKTPRHEHDFNEQPGGKCICGQRGVPGQSLDLCKRKKERNAHAYCGG